MEQLKNIKKMEISALCKLGKFGVGKSLMLGMFEFDIPEKTKKNTIEKRDNEEKF